jgi:protein-tyrosine kinase
VTTSQIRDQHLVSLTAPGSVEAEQYRLLRHIVEQARKESDTRVVAVTSATVGDGKTTTAINLAGALAQSRHASVLLVDLDLRRGTIGAQFGPGAGRPGVTDFILDSDLKLADVVRPWASSTLAIVPAGRVSTEPWELLKARRLGEFLDEARSRWDHVIVDTPPLVPVPDCRIIAKWIDAFFLVVAANKTPRRLVEDALDAFEPAKLAGLVFNGDDRWTSGYYGSYGAYASPADGRGPWWRRLIGARP